MIKINMVGGDFQHAYSSSGWSTPSIVDWDKSGGADISIHIDRAAPQTPNKSKRNFAWFCESFAINHGLFDWIHKNIPHLEDNFELIFTYDKRLLPLSDKIKLILPNAVPWVTDHGIHNKSKLVSGIMSIKNMCPGHLFRQKMLRKYENEIDSFGTGHRFVEHKDDALRDYFFSFAMENDTYPNYFTEKITDCFAMGTIPIFWGPPTIGEFFNEKGIIFLTDDFKVEDLTKDLYYSKMDYIKENFEIAIKFPIAEDYIYENFIK